MLKKIVNKARYLIKKYLFRDKFLWSAHKWFKDKGDEILRVNYNLNKDSIVFDLGGYKGEFAEAIYDKYKSKIFIFEPVSSFCENIKNKFINNSNISLYNFGLSNKDETLEISLIGDGSSVHINNSKKELIQLKSIETFLNENNISHIDLFKINIEGGEFEVLPELIKIDFIKNIDNLQIQFHNFIDNAENKREEIRKELSKTHKLTYDYYFIWENWQKK